MPAPPRDEITRLLQRAGQGDESATDQLAALIYAELRVLASSFMGRQPAGHTLQPTALVNEAWIRLAGGEGGRWESRQHFFKAAAKAMRSALLDHARRKSALKRSGQGERVPLDDALASYEQLSIDFLALDEALQKLERVDPELARIVELRFFAGLSIPETAQMLAISTATVERGWRTARALLQIHLMGETLDGC